MRLRDLISVDLLLANKIKGANGLQVNEYQIIKPFNVCKQDINDEVSSNIYGASINQMYRLSSPLKKLEQYLQKKINNDSDNISKYFISIKNVKYKIKVVKDDWIDIERL